jgi:hypothetical protein
MKNLDWNSIRKIGRQDSANRWYPSPEIAEYFSALRAPSRAWPHSYAKAAQTAKFFKWLEEKKPEIAKIFSTKEESHE